MLRKELAIRLKRARDAVGLSINEAAKRLGFPNYQTLSSIEKGQREVKASELVLFAKTYFCDLNQLLANGEVPTAAVKFLWRRAPAKGKTEVEAAIKQKLEAYHLLEELLGLSGDWTGTIISVNKGTILNNSSIDKFADDVSHLLDLGSRPALSLQKVMEQGLGIKILFTPLSEFGSAASTVHPELGAAIVVNNEEAPWRINFTLAHELFHILTWTLFNPLEFEQDQGLFKEIEKKADRFASTLLLPEKAVRDALKSRIKENRLSFSDIVDAARAFEVSTQALLYRMANMGLMGWEKANELAKSDELRLIDRRLRKGSDYETPISDRFILLSVMCLRKGLISRGKFSELLGIDRADIDHYLVHNGLSEVEGESIEIMVA